MSRRFIITGIIAALLLGGLAWFNFSFKPNMIKTIMSSQVPPPATVTAEAARTEKWIEQLPSIGTLISSHGVDMTSQVAGIVTEVYLESGADADARHQPRAARHRGRTRRSRQRQGDPAGSRGGVSAAGGPDRQARHVGSQPGYGACQARHRVCGREQDRGRDRAEDDQGAGLRPARHPQGGAWAVRVAGHGAGHAAAARSDPRRLPDAGAADQQAARGPAARV